jgi:Holliday junction DNA helicase RuvA
MIHFLNGILSEVTDESVVVEAGGVGYQVYVPLSVQSQLPELGEPVKVYTYHYIREDQQALFGFLRTEDRQLFSVLITVSGVGPKVGVKFFSALHANQVVGAIVGEDIALLTSVPGVGKKLAERIVIELKDKLPKQFHLELGGWANSRGQLPGKQLNALGADLGIALKQLGYAQDEIKSALSRASGQLTETMPLEVALKVVFRHLVN